MVKRRSPQGRALAGRNGPECTARLKTEPVSVGVESVASQPVLPPPLLPPLWKVESGDVHGRRLQRSVLVLVLVLPREFLVLFPTFQLLVSSQTFFFLLSFLALFVGHRIQKKKQGNGFVR